MSNKDLKVIVSIIAGFVLIIGFGIGIKLYSATSQGGRIDQLNPRSNDTEK